VSAEPLGINRRIDGICRHEETRPGGVVADSAAPDCRRRLHGAGQCLAAARLVPVLLALAAGSPAASPLLHIALTFDAGAARSIEMAVTQEAARVWAAYGIEVDGPPMTAGGRPGTITLHVSMARRPAHGTNDQSLGSIVFHDGVPEPSISLYVASADDLISTAAEYDPSHWPPAFHDELLGRVLGRALAHEIGHYVLRMRGHSTFGLMRAVHPIAELMEIRGRNLALSPDDRETLCEELSSHSGA